MSQQPCSTLGHGPNPSGSILSAQSEPCLDCRLRTPCLAWSLTLPLANFLLGHHQNLNLNIFPGLQVGSSIGTRMTTQRIVSQLHRLQLGRWGRSRKTLDQHERRSLLLATIDLSSPLNILLVAPRILCCCSCGCY